MTSHLCGGLGKHRERGRDGRQVDLTGLGQFEPVVHALEKSDAEMLFKRLYLLAYCALRQKQLFSGSRAGEMPCRSIEYA